MSSVSDRRSSWSRRLAVLGLASILSLPAFAEDVAVSTAPATRPAEWKRDEPAIRARSAQLCERGARFLLQTQEKSGGWNTNLGPGITCLVVKALVQQPDFDANHPAIARAVDYVLSNQRDDGGIYGEEGRLKNYESSVALSMLAALRRPADEPRVARLQQFLKDLQWDETESISTDNPWYGGAGYGYGKRPDLSNTQMMLEALHDSGLPPDDPAYKKALVFIERSQMMSETNDQPFARGSWQGGFIYSPANGGESKAGKTEIGGRPQLRAYGSMSYAGLKSMLYAGLTRDDPRVRAVVQWLRAHWTLDQNPNMPPGQAGEGLYYFYHVFGRAMEAVGEPVIEEISGRERVWRHELVNKLGSLQKPDGSWVNNADRWFEGYPPLTTAYAMLALQAAYPSDGQATE